MTIQGLAAAVVLGGAIGILGRLVTPDRPNMPVWLLMAAGVVAAFAGTGLAHMFGFAADGWSAWETLFQAVVAAVGVFLVVAFWPKRTGDRS